jgi:hypothetical protein
VSLRKESSELTAEASDPHRGPGPPARPDSPHHIGVRSRHASQRRGIVRESSAGKTRPPTAFIAVDKACSATAVRETAFVRPRCAPRITKEHSAAV